MNVLFSTTKNMKITKAVITAAGRGTRFLPASAAYQKEMVPVLEKPQLQWVIEEAIEAGITDIAVVVREGVDTFKRYLEKDDTLWNFLKETGKESFMDSWVEMMEKVNITIFEQKESDPYGNGTPFILTKEWTNGEPIAAMWGDDIMVRVDNTKPTCIEQLAQYYERYNPSAVMAVRECTKDEITKVASYEYFHSGETEIPYHAKRSIEKPLPGEEPSLYGNACRFILGPDVFEEVSKRIEGKSDEIWLTDATNRLMQQGKVVIAAPWEGDVVVPCGDPLHWLMANITMAKNLPEYRDDIMKFLKETVKDVE